MVGSKIWADAGWLPVYSPLRKFEYIHMGLVNFRWGVERENNG